MRSPTRASFGTASLSTSSLFVFSCVDKLENPVILPPGRARLATKPAATGSPAFAITMGMVVVAFFAANAGGVSETTIRSTLRRTKSAASSGRRSLLLSANRYSMVIFFPSIHPSLRSSCRNASTRTAHTGSSAIIQETYAEDFSWLLRVGGTAKRKEHGAKRKDGDSSLHVFFSASIHSTQTLDTRPCHLIT